MPAQAAPGRFRLALTLMLAFALASFLRPVTAQQLPDLGGAGGGLLSSQQEAAIADQVMRSLRLSMPLLRDPLLEDYLANLVYKLVPYAPLEHRELTLVILDDPAINAFAVPGGIIGVNAGLFLNADNEHQFASVLAHELAHLSQRHFARRMEQQQRTAPMALAGMIAGIILSAVTQSDVGIAAIAGSQALAIQNMLQYSRSNEQEADRVGLEIMARAGFNPRAMPEMFEHMLRRARLQGSRPPEYLSTHPLTESRVSDTQNRAAQYSGSGNDFRDSVEYHLMRARLLVRYAPSADDAIENFREQRSKQEGGRTIALEYGLALALLEKKQAQPAADLLEQLLEQEPGRISLVYSLAEAQMALGQEETAAKRLESALHRNPGNFPLQQSLAEAQMALDKPAAAARLYQQLTREYPQNTQLWQKLADAQVEARNIVEVHRARAEYELLMNNPDRAIMHLREAIRRAEGNLPQQQALRARLDAAQQQREAQRTR